MCATLLLLKTQTWSHWSAEILEQARTGRTRIVALDLPTAGLLRAQSVPFSTIEDGEPPQSWEQTNSELYALLLQFANPDDEDVIVFSHYLISETNRLFDTIGRIRTLVERDRPSVLAIGADDSDASANELHAAAVHLPWPANLCIRRWDLQGPLSRV